MPRGGRLMPGSAVRSRLGAVALTAGGVLFVLYPATRPWRDESTAGGATQSMSSGAWVAAHLFAMIGFILVTLGLLALYGAVSRTRAERAALAAVATSWIGAGQNLDLLGLVAAIPSNPVAAPTSAPGLRLLGAGPVLAAVAIWRSGALPRY